MNYDDNWRFLNQFVDMKIGEYANNLKAYWVKVITSDGYYASVKFATSESAKLLPLTKIPILQSKYHSPIVMPNDEGLLLNLHQNLDPQLSGVNSQSIKDINYYVFLPLISKSNYKGAFNKQRISNSLLNTYIELADDGITIESVKKIEVSAVENFNLQTKAMSINSEESLNIETKAMSINSEESLNIETKTMSINSSDSLTTTSAEISFNGDSKIALESGGDLSIKASSPIEFGTSQTLGKALNDLCAALSSFMTLPVSPGAPAAPDPGFLAKITQVQTALSQILKS